MSFLSPLYLLLLIPWGGLVYWLLSGQGQHTVVPFLALWGGSTSTVKVRRRIQPPPMALACACVAILLAIVAASGPSIGRISGAGPITIIVDRGVTMAAKVDGQSQRDRLVDEVGPVIADKSPSSIRLIFVPGAEQLSTADRWEAIAKNALFSPIDTRELLTTAIADAVRRNDGPVVVLSDRKLDDSRVIQVSPASIAQNVDIVRFAASELPRSQVMLRLRNQSKLKTASVTITSGTSTVQQSVQLRNDFADQDLFFDLPALADRIEASVNVDDDLAIDNHASLVRQHAWPKLEPQMALPADLERMIQVYQKLRPASDQSARVAITSDSSSDPMVQIASDLAKLQPIGRTKIEPADHPITRGVNWSAIGANASASPIIEPIIERGWTPIVRAGSLVFVAVRESPVRQVRVAFAAPNFSQTADFVIFWTNVFDWVGNGGGDEFAAEPVKALGDEWKLESSAIRDFDLSPGIYRRGDGARVAMNVEDVRFDQLPNSDWKTKLDRYTKPQAAGSRVQDWFVFAAIGLTLLATALWKRAG